MICLQPTVVIIRQSTRPTDDNPRASPTPSPIYYK